MRKIIKKTTAPIYAFAFTWVFWGLFLPLYRVWHFFFAAALSVLVAWIAGKIWKDKTVFVLAPEEPETTGNPALDRLVAEGKMADAELLRLSKSIADPGMRDGVLRIREICGKIIAHVRENPEKLKKNRRFINYYLPTTLKILNAYDRLGAQGIEGENIDGTMLKIENAREVIESAFSRQLDSLFSDEALDISADITVLDNLMKSEGLSGRETAGNGNDSPAAGI